MRKVSFAVLAAAIFLGACKSKTKQTYTSDDGKTKTEVSYNLNQMAKASEDMQKKTEELQKLTPLTLDQLKAMVPETLMGAKRSDYNATNAMGTSVVTAEYKIDDSTDIKLTIYDCAGPGGVGLYSMQFMAMLNIQSESDDEYTRTVDYNGSKAVEQCHKSSKRCTFNYFANDRLWVGLEGDHVGIDDLKKAAGELNLK